jgi:hypothetical protein
MSRLVALSRYPTGDSTSKIRANCDIFLPHSDISSGEESHDAGLDQILGRLAPMARSTALTANARDNQPVAGHSKVVLLTHGIADFRQLVAVKLDQFVAHLAIEVIMLRVAVVMLVDGSTAEGHFSEEARLYQLGERTIDGGPADGASFRLAGQAGDELVGVEVIVPLKDVLDENPPLLGDPLATALQVFVEPLLR